VLFSVVLGGEDDFRGGSGGGRGHPGGGGRVNQALAVGFLRTRPGAMSGERENGFEKPGRGRGAGGYRGWGPGKGYQGRGGYREGRGPRPSVRQIRPRSGGGPAAGSRPVMKGLGCSLRGVATSVPGAGVACCGDRGCCRAGAGAITSSNRLGFAGGGEPGMGCPGWGGRGTFGQHISWASLFGGEGGLGFRLAYRAGCAGGRGAA